LAATDVDHGRFDQVIKAIKPVGNNTYGMTLYASAADAALWWSGKAASDDSAGTVTKDGPVVVTGVESIDMTSTNPKRSVVNRFWQNDPLRLNTHNTFVNPVIVDIARLVMRGEHPPPLRTSAIRGGPEDTPEATYWRNAD
jgi:hypothetical protein